MTKTASHKKRMLKIAQRGCFGKVQHKSMLAAEFILSKMGGKNSERLEIYKCKFCNWFHIGHNNQKEKNGKETLLSSTK